MITPNKIVLDYLFENTNFEDKLSYCDRLIEIAEAYETVPEEVLDAYEKLTNYEMWTIIGKMATEGKRKTK